MGENWSEEGIARVEAGEVEDDRFGRFHPHDAKVRGELAPSIEKSLGRVHVDAVEVNHRVRACLEQRLDQVVDEIEQSCRKVLTTDIVPVLEQLVVKDSQQAVDSRE